jgi:hypothetical protein
MPIRLCWKLRSLLIPTGSGRALLHALCCVLCCVLCCAAFAQSPPAPAPDLAPPSAIQLPANPATQPQPGEVGFVPLSGSQRASLFFKGYVASPIPYLTSIAEATVTLMADDPDGWGRNWNDYGKRVGTNFALLTMEEGIHDAGDAALRLDPRYFRCRCSGVWPRAWHALKMTALAYDGDGRLHLDLPRFVADYGSSMIVTTGYPPHYAPLVQGVQMGHMQVGSDAGMNLLREFSPDLKRIFHRRKPRQP